MKAKITLPTGAVIEVDASEAEIRRLAGEHGYRLEMLPMVPPAICICGRAFFSTIPPVCPVHGQPFRFDIFAETTLLKQELRTLAANPGIRA